MACKYWYDGSWRSEEEFKSILENGLIDDLIKNNFISLSNFEIDPTKIKDTVKKTPVTLRVRRKIDSNINNRINPSDDTRVFQNPLTAIKNHNKQRNLTGNKEVKLKFVIKVKGQLYTGKGKKNEAILQELNDSAIRYTGESIKDTLQEGAVYMLVPSAYGLYPVKVFNNFVKDTTVSNDVSKMLKLLKTGKQENIEKVNEFVNEVFYRIIVKYNEKNDTFYIKKYDPELSKFTTQSFKTIEEAEEFLGNQLYRVDNHKINNKKYNEDLASKKVIKTDVFSERGSFFHSPSFVIDAYQMGEEDIQNSQKILELFVPTEKFSQSEIESQEGQKNKKNKSEESEGPLYKTPVTNLKSIAEKKPQEIRAVKYTRKGQKEQTYTIDGTGKKAKIFNKDGKEVFVKDSKDRRAIFAKLAYQEGRAVMVKYKGNNYIISNKTKDIFSVTSKEIMKWGPEDGNRKAIMELYEKKIAPAEIKIRQPITQKEFKEAKAKFEELKKEAEEKIDQAEDSRAVGREEVSEMFQQQLIMARNYSTPILQGMIDKKRKKLKKAEAAGKSKGEASGKTNREYQRLASLAPVLRKELKALENLLAEGITPKEAAEQGISSKKLQETKTEEVIPPGLKSISKEQPDIEQDLSSFIPGYEGGLEQQETQDNSGSDYTMLKDLIGGTENDTDVVRKKPTDKKRAKDLDKPIQAFNWTQQEKIDWLINKLGDQFLKGTKGKKRAIKFFKTIEDVEKYLPKESYEQLLEARKNGEELYGLFTTAMVLIADNAPSGVVFHEAFHVVFNLILPLDKRIELVYEAFEKYRDELPNVDTGKKDVDGNPIMRLPTFLEVEELLADKFMDYTISLEKNKPKSQKLTKTFKGMRRMMKTFFSPNGISIDGIFEDINLGRYVNEVNFKDTVLPRSSRRKVSDEPQTTNPEKKYLDPLAEKESLDYMTQLFDEVMVAAQKKLDPNNEKNYSNTDIIKKIGFDTILSAIGTKAIGEHLRNLKKPEDKQDIDPKEQKLFLDVLTDSQKSIDLDFYEEKKLLRFKSVNDYIRRFVIHLQRKGIYIKLDGSNQIMPSTANSTNYKEIEALNELENGEETGDSVAMRVSVEVDPRETMGEKLKNLFATFPIYRSRRKNAAPIINRFGVESKEDPGKVFSILVKEISNSYTLSDMDAKIDKINHPWVRTLKEAIKKDPTIRTLLWANIGSKHYATYMVVRESQGTYVPFTANRKKVDDIIKEELITNFLVPYNPLFIKVKGKVDFNKIDMDLITDVNGDFKTLKVVFDHNKLDEAFWKNIKQRDAFFEDISKTLKRIEINITTDQLISIYNSEEEGELIKESIKKISKLLEVLGKVLDTLETGKGSLKTNPFTSIIPTDKATRDELKDARTLIEDLAKALEPALSKEVVSSFMGINGKAKYNLINSGHLNKELDKLKSPEKLEEYLNKIEDDPLMSGLPILEDIKDDTTGLQKRLGTVILDGFTREGKNRSTDYSSMSDIEIAATDMNLFYNSKSKEETYIRISIPSDSPTIHYIETQKLSKTEILEKLLQLARAEQGRIQVVRNLDSDSKLLNVSNYEERGRNFEILPFLNTPVKDAEGNLVDLRVSFNDELALQAIENFFQSNVNNSKFFKNEIGRFYEKGIIQSINEETGVITFHENILDKGITDKTEFFKNYLLNAFYYNTQFNLLFNKDSAFYAGPLNQQKRGKQLVSPGIYPATEAIFKAMIIKDGEVPTRKEFIDYIINKINESDTISEDKKQDLKVFWSNKFIDAKNYKGNNISDGGTFVSIAHRRAWLKSLGKLGEAEIAALNRIEAGTETLEDLSLIQSPTKPEKPYMVSSYILEGIEIPFQAKNAETVLTKSFALRKDNEGNYINPKLAAAYMDMNGPNKKFDVLYFESAVKVGALGISKTSKGEIEFADYTFDEDSQTWKLPEEKLINTESGFLELEFGDLRLQQETPEHYIDDRSNFGTQLRNLILADIDMEGEYVMGEFYYTGRELVTMYQDLIVENIKESFEQVASEFENPDGSINYDFLVEKLRQEIIDRELGPEFLEALAPVQEVLGKEDGSNTALPLYHPLICYRMESLMNSFFKNRVTKQKIKGGQLVNTPSWGISDQLEVIKDPYTGGIIFEAYIPWTSRELFPTNKNGEVNLDFIKKHAPELLDIVANRIPTEDKYSMFSIRVKGFTPQSMGGTIILPPEALTISGFDFDIDKLFFMSREFKEVNGIPQVIKFLDFDSEEDLDIIAKNIYSSYSEFKRFLDKTNFTEEYKEGLLVFRQGFIDRRYEADKAKKELFKSEKHVAIYNKIKALKYALKNAKSKKKVYKYRLEIDNLYSELEQDFVPFKEEEAFIDEQTNKVIKEIKEKIQEGTFSNFDFNGRRARNNQLINIIEAILRAEQTAALMLEVADTSPLKERGARITLLQKGLKKEANTLKGKTLIAKGEEVRSTDLNINYPSTQLTIFRQNMDGKKLIGPFANNSTHHAKAQFTNLKLRESIEVDGKFYQALNESVIDGVRISRILATNLAAIVDNTKDPIANPLNINIFTVDVIALQNRLGISEDFTYALINQPIILKLTNAFLNEQGSISEQKQFAAIKAIYKNYLQIKVSDSGMSLEDFNNLELTTELLENNLKPNIDSAEFLAVQLKALEFFETQKTIGAELSRGVQAGKVDTQGVGPSSAHNFVLLEKQQIVLDQELQETSMIEGLQEIFQEDSFLQKMIPAFNLYGIIKPSNIMNKIFPYFGTVEMVEDSAEALKVRQTVYSALGHIKRKLGASKPSGVLTEREASLVDMHFMNFITSAFPFFNYAENKKIILDFPKDFVQFKNNLPEDSPYKVLLDQIYTVEADGYGLIKRLEYYNTGKNSTDTYLLRESWKKMLLDSDPEIKNFAFNLIKYTFFANGLGFGAKSFSHLIPVMFFTDDFQTKNDIVDTKGNTFNQFLDKALNSQKFEAGNTTHAKRFIDQFLRNFANAQTFVKSVKVNKVLTKFDVPVDEREADRLETLTAKEQGIVKTSNGDLIINRDKNKDLVTRFNNDEPMAYIKVFRKTRYSDITGAKIPDPYRVDIYKLDRTSLATGVKNPALFDGKTEIDTWRYVQVSNLGLYPISLEFDFAKDLENSLLELAPKVKSVSVAKNMSRSQEDVDDIIRQMMEQEVAPTTVSINSIQGKNNQKDSYEKGMEALESVAKNSNFIELSTDETKYVHKTKKDEQGNPIEYERVTSFITGGKKIDKTPLITSSTTIGTKADDFIRDFFEEAEKIKWEAGTQEFLNHMMVTLIDAHDFAPETDLMQAIQGLTEIKINMDSREEKVFAKDMLLAAEDFQGTGRNIAGTVDLISIDKHGIIRIYDVKTMRGNQFTDTHKSGINKGEIKYYYRYSKEEDSNSEKHQKQLSMYNLLLQQSQGVSAKYLGVLPYEISYQPGDTVTTKFKQLKGVLFEQLSLDQIMPVEPKDKDPLAGLKRIDQELTKKATTPYSAFTDILNTLPKEKQVELFVSEEEFNKYSAKERETIMWQLKNCG